MKPTVLLACVVSLFFGGCAWFSGAGPSTNEVIEQAQAGGEILFDVVAVDDRVVSTLRAQPPESFARRFKENPPPGEINIAIGDTVSVVIWESAAGGLFSEAPPTPSRGTRPETEPLAPEAPILPGERLEEFAAPGAQPPQQRRPAQEPLAAEAAGFNPGRRPAIIPDQQVGTDGAISVPYAGRIAVAGRSPQDVQEAIQSRLATKALQPQALVLIKKSAANSVTVTGEMVAGARVPLSPGGDRLLQVIAAAGGAKAPLHETFVRLSRRGITATMPLRRLVSDPAEDIYAQPGDVLTLVRAPQTFTVFGATGRNAEIPFGAEGITVSEALGKSHGLRDDLAKPEGVFLFRYEADSVIRALGQPLATWSEGGVSPIVYRFNLRAGDDYLLAQEFPVHDKDVIFVADAPAAQLYKFAAALNKVTGPIITGLLVCQNRRC
ncbi:MAG TPA: polysaccharide biosynthesis/export family protein [Stellaceae bacterium]|nr:polysaccharide biosynthesis/export family protein [Stellaceae bacterium]